MLKKLQESEQQRITSFVAPATLTDGSYSGAPSSPDKSQIAKRKKKEMSVPTKKNSNIIVVPRDNVIKLSNPQTGVQAKMELQNKLKN